MAKKLIGYKLNGSIIKIFKYSLKDIQDFCQLDNVDGDDLNER